MTEENGNKQGKHLTPAEVEMVLRRAAEITARRKKPGTSERASVSTELLVQVASAVGIPDPDVRRALADLTSAKAFEPDSLPKRLYGGARLRAVREIEQPSESTRQHLENLLRLEQGLKLRSKTEASSLWDSGDMLGMVRRTLDFSDHRALLKAQSVELRVKEASEARSYANLTADFSNQRSEYLSLGGILGATFALPLAIAGAYEPLYFLLVLPALTAPGLGFRLAYKKSCADIRRALDAVLDAAERRAPEEEPEDFGSPDDIRDFDRIPRYSPRQRDE